MWQGRAAAAGKSKSAGDKQRIQLNVDAASGDKVAINEKENGSFHIQVNAASGDKVDMQVPGLLVQPFIKAAVRKAEKEMAREEVASK